MLQIDISVLAAIAVGVLLSDFEIAFDQCKTHIMSRITTVLVIKRY